jgi:transcriptional regulator with XRE-family HTH domain
MPCVGVSELANIQRLVDQILRKSGLSQAELARRAGLPRSVVNVYARGRREPGVGVVARLALAAGLELSLRPRTQAGKAALASSRIERVLDRANDLVQKLFAIHDSLAEAKLAHAFGGAVALAYCTEEPRGARDLDVNVFCPPADAERALAALPGEITVSPKDAEAAVEDGQWRLWWEETPVDVFLSSMEFHEEVAERVLWVPLAGRTIPVVDCRSLVVFKALIDRTRDWADIEACVAACDPREMAGASVALGRLLGEGDVRLAQLEQLRHSSGPGSDEVIGISSGRSIQRGSRRSGRLGRSGA